MTLKSLLRKKPVIYEIVPPRKDTSRFSTELSGVEDILNDSRIAAINIPELFSRAGGPGAGAYSPATIPPEEYALLIKEYKEPIVNIVAPRLERQEFLLRARRALHDYGIYNLVVVGKERKEDVLPGPSAVEGLQLLGREKGEKTALGGICIFNRESETPVEYGGGSAKLTEARRVSMKAKAGCDFVTSQIVFEPSNALSFFDAYRSLCEEERVKPVTVFVSLTTIPTQTIQSLLEGLDVVIPPIVGKRLRSASNMGRESVRVATEVFYSLIRELENMDDHAPLGLQIEQVGVNSDELSLSLLDEVHSIF